MIGKEELFLVRNYIIILKDSDDIYIAFPGLTILTGTNNLGKSSLIQSIRVLSMMGKTWEPYLPLDKIEGLGGLKDVLNKGVKAHIELEFTSALAEGEVVDMRQPDAALLTKIRIVIEDDDTYSAFVFSYLDKGQYLLEEGAGKSESLPTGTWRIACQISWSLSKILRCISTQNGRRI